MSDRCTQLRAAFLAGGREAIEKDRDLDLHRNQCDACQRLLGAIDRIDKALQDVEEPLVPTPLVEKTLATVNSARNRPPPWRRNVSATAASLLVAAALFSLVREYGLMSVPAATQSLSSRSELAREGLDDVAQAPGMAGEDQDGHAAEYGAGLRAQLDTPEEKPKTPSPAPPVAESEPTPWSSAEGFADPATSERTDRMAATPPPVIRPDDASREYKQRGPAPGGAAARDMDNLGDTAQFRASAVSDAVGELSAEELDESVVVGGERGRFESNARPRPKKDAASEREEIAGQAIDMALGRYANRPAPPAAATVPARIASNESTPRDNRQQGAGGKGGGDSASMAAALPREQLLARVFPEFADVDGLTIQPASGYWSNRYVPGDPEIRRLQVKLADWEPAVLGIDEPLALAAETAKQPVDPPRDHALDLNLLTDVGAIEDRDRLRLQVGLRAIGQDRGRRPAMNLQVIVDLDRNATDGERAQVLALIDALAVQRQAVDTVALNVTGDYGLRLAAEEFREGPLTFARAAIAAPPQGDRPVPLAEALSAARSRLEVGAAAAMEGTQTVLLFAVRALDDDFARVQSEVEAMARSGVRLTVVPIGDRAASAQIEALLRAGLGHRRLLAEPADAGRLIAAELDSAGAVVARAVRLSIRLAEGVELIDVLGAQRLDQIERAQVKAVEEAVDRRLAANLGIAADRGDDESGIQIVVPLVAAGDDVVILLDLIASGPGPLADVSVRYKDVAFGRNNVLRKQAVLQRGAARLGPAQRTVLYNLLVHRLTQELRVVSALVRSASGSSRQAALSEAAQRLQQVRNRLSAARAAVSAWRSEPAISADIALVNRFIEALQSPQAINHLDPLAAALELAAWRKTHRRHL